MLFDIDYHSPLASVSVKERFPGERITEDIGKVDELAQPPLSWKRDLYRHWGTQSGSGGRSIVLILVAVIA